MGKSRLSLEVAARRLAEHPDGVWFVELASTGAPDLLPTAIATALHLDLSAARGAHAALVDHLRDKRLLLVLDNFEHLVEGAGLLEELLAAAPGLVILATSRVALGLRTETLFELDGLSTPPPGTTSDLRGFDAVALFIDRAERLSTGFVASGATLTAVADLARRVEGMPLALELAASWTRSLTTPELVTELDGSLDLLSASLRDLPPRHRSIRTVIAYSWGLLTDAERRALERLSVFRGGFSQAAAQQVAGVHLALLLGLVSHSLVMRARGGRFHLHELVRLFAGEKLTGSAGAEATTELHAALSRYYLALLVDRSPRLRTPARASVLGELFEDIDNIRLALADATARFDEEQLAAALPHLFTLYLEGGALDELTARLDGLVSAAHARGTTDGRLTVEATLQLGRAHMSHGAFGAARAALEPVAEHLRAATGPDGEADLARVLDWLGSCARIMGDREAAERYVTEALHLAERLGERGAVAAQTLLADATYNLASLRLAQGRMEEALQLFERSLDLSLGDGDDVGAAVRRLSIARMQIMSGADLDQAQRHLDEALTVGRAARASRVEGGALNALAVLAGAQGDQAGAERFNLESLALARRQAQHDDQRAALANLGGILNGQGRLDEAAVYLRQALELAQRSGNPAGLNQAYALVAENCSLRGDHGAAAAYFRSGLDPTVMSGTPPTGQAQCLSLLANAHERAGRTEEARELRRHLSAHPATPPGLRHKLEDLLAASPERAAAGGRELDAPATPSLLDLAAKHRASLGGAAGGTVGGALGGASGETSGGRSGGKSGERSGET
jgi:predicted ATPase